MKLLPKQKVNSIVQDEKRAQIEEGINLARKIDALREKLADLQKQHELFVSGMEENLKERTDDLFKEIERRKVEIKLLEVKRQELLKPLDFEWKIIKERLEGIEQRELNLKNEKDNLKRKEEGIQKKHDEAKEILSHIKVRERELTTAYSKAEDNLEVTEKIKLEIIQTKQKQDKLFEKKRKEQNEREAVLDSYKFTLDNRQEKLDEQEKLINEEKVRLADQRATLERAFNRIKHKI
jgi:hypothetical protein